MKTRYLMLLTTLAFLGLCVSVPAFAGKDKNCDPNKGDVHPNCGGGDGGGGTATGYTVALTMGGFRFKAVEIIPNNKGNAYNSSTLQLIMDRPFSVGPPDPVIDWAYGDEVMWDKVFEACGEVFGVDNDPWPIYDVNVSPGWGVTQGGGKRSDFATNIRIAFRDIIADGYPDVKSGFVLYTADTFYRDAFLPLEGYTSVYPLDRAYIQADDIANQRVCRPTSLPLVEGRAILEICHKDKISGICDKRTIMR